MSPSTSPQCDNAKGVPIITPPLAVRAELTHETATADSLADKCTCCGRETRSAPLQLLRVCELLQSWVNRAQVQAAQRNRFTINGGGRLSWTGG
jgi:hypothetical protein